jgi:hypothetical protein
LSDEEIKRHVVAALEGASAAAGRNPRIADYVAGRIDVAMHELELDSLAGMEFCIAIELSTGVSIVPHELQELGTLTRVADSIRARLA